MDVHQRSQKEAWKFDLMLICRTLAMVYPFSSVPQIVSQTAIIIEINSEPTPLTERISKYLIQGKIGEMLHKVVEEVRKILKVRRCQQMK